MKTTELMIGDWVIGSIVDRGRVVAIDDEDEYKTHHGSVRIKYSEDFAGNGEWADKISPIPLTPDILEKNGFQKEYARPWMLYRLDNMGLYKQEFGYATSFGMSMRPLRYVHELQHALRMCGLDKLADNFKI